MDKLDRLQKLHRLFRSHRLPVSLETIAEELECTTKTADRNVKALRDYFQAPLKYLPRRGWKYEEDSRSIFELPGFWLTAQELQSMALLLYMLENFGSGLLGTELKAIKEQINKLLKDRGLNSSLLTQKLKVLPLATRHMPNVVFLRLSAAVIKGRRLTIRYKSYQHQTTTREISPQTLVYYRDNWYVDAWCHARKALRTFSLSRIEKIFPEMEQDETNNRGEIISKSDLESHFIHSYGLFAGKPRHTARLRFYPEIAREIAMQQWHPEQESRWEGEDYLLAFPYSDARELIGDILRHVPNVRVEAPAELRRQVRNRLLGGLELFE